MPPRTTSLSIAQMPPRTTSLSIEIPELPPSPNATRRNAHWSHRARLDKKWRDYGASLDDGLPPPLWEKVRLAITFFLPDRRRRDPGNLVGSEGLKGLIDGFVDAGIITDDNIGVIEQYGPFTFTYRKGKPGTLVTITPL
jgi:Holliday junction resolvase RusA-like endonuclease